MSILFHPHFSSVFSSLSSNNFSLQNIPCSCLPSFSRSDSPCSVSLVLSLSSSYSWWFSGSPRLFLLASQTSEYTWLNLLFHQKETGVLPNKWPHVISQSVREAWREGRFPDSSYIALSPTYPFSSTFGGIVSRVTPSSLALSEQRFLWMTLEILLLLKAPLKKWSLWPSFSSPYNRQSENCMFICSFSHLTSFFFYITNIVAGCVLGVRNSELNGRVSGLEECMSCLGKHEKKNNKFQESVQCVRAR